MTAARRSVPVVAVTLLVVLSPVVGFVSAATQGDGSAVRESTTSPDSRETTANASDLANTTPSTAGDNQNTTRQENEDNNITFVEPDKTTVTETEVDPDYTIDFWSGSFTPEPGLDPVVTDTTRDRVWVLVQFEAKPFPATIDQLGEYGYRDVARLTTTTRYASIPTEEAEQIAQLDSVRAVFHVRPEWKLHPSFDADLEARPPEDPVTVSLLTFTPLDAETVDRDSLTLVRKDDRGTAFYKGELSPSKVREYQQDPRVAWIENRSPDQLFVSEGRRLVGAHMAETSGLYSSGYTGQGVRVGVIDSGIEHGHPHFSSVNIIDSYDWNDGDNNPEAAAGCDHGTHVAGTIAGSGFDSDRRVQIRGVAPDADLVIANKYGPDTNGDGKCDDAAIIPGPQTMFNTINEENVDIISMSYGRDNGGRYLSKASRIDTWAINHPDVLLVTSNGNACCTSHTGTPGVAKNILTVGSVGDGSSKNVSGGSVSRTNVETNDVKPPVDTIAGSGRKKPELYAPGESITAPVLNGDYDEKSGTSMAAPHVSGAAAILMEKYPNKDANFFRAELIATAVEPRYDGYGIVNVNNALHTNPYESRHAHASDSVAEAGVFQKSKVENDYYNITITQDTERLVVALTWLDPGNWVPARRTQMANNLYLHVSGPGVDRTVNTRSNVKHVVIDDPGQGDWTIRVQGKKVTAGNPQDYDLVYRTVTEKPSLEVDDSRTVEVEPWEDRKRQLTFNVSGTGAPVSGIYLDADRDSLSFCDGTRDATIVGLLSASHEYTKDLCVELSNATTTNQTESVTVTLNTSNAERIDGQSAQNVTRTVTYELLPRPDADRFDDTESNDRQSDATDVIAANDWSHTHLTCVEQKPYNNGEPMGGDCSGVLEGRDQYKAREHWQTSLENLSLHKDTDEDHYEISLPSTHTPKLPSPECGEQNVTLRGDKKRIKTEGQLIIRVSPTENTLGEAKVRSDLPETPINVYNDSGPVTDGTTTLGFWGDDVRRTIPCPQSKGIDELTFSFGEGSARNLGSYEIEVHYIIDITRVDDYGDAQEKLIRQVEQAKKIERRAVFEEQLPDDGPIDDINDDLVDQFGGDDDGRPSCYTHCGYPGGLPRDFLENGEVVVNLNNDEGEVVDQTRVTFEDGDVAVVERDVDSGIIGTSVDACSGDQALDNGGAGRSIEGNSVSFCTDLHTARQISGVENSQLMMTSAYRSGLVRFGGAGFLDGLYVGGPTIELRTDGSAAVTTEATYDLSDDQEAEQFEALREDGAFHEELLEMYSTRMGWVADDWSNEIDREMAVRNARIEFTVRETEDGPVGVASLTIDWIGFAAQTDDGLVVERPFASGFVADQPMTIYGPDGHQLASASVPPMEPVENGATWESGTSMSDFGVRFVASESTETEVTTSTPTETDSDTTPTEPTPTTSPGFGLLLALFALLTAALGLSRRG